MSQQVNLLDPARRGSDRRVHSAALMLAGIIATLTIAAGAAIHERRQLDAVAHRAAATARALQELEAAPEFAAAQRAAAPAPAADPVLAQLAAELKDRAQVLAALRNGAAGSTDGFSEYMKALSRQTLDGVWLTGFELREGGTQVTLEGRALHAALVPQYLTKLSREAQLSGRKLSALRMSANESPGDDKDAAGKAAGMRFVQFTVTSGAAGVEQPTAGTMPRGDRDPAAGSANDKPVAVQP